VDEDNIIQEINKRIERMEAIYAISNCFHKYLQYLSLQHKPGVLECFALECEDVSFESAKSGVYVGADSISRYFDYLPEMAKLRGMLYEQFSFDQVIEIARDGRTAKLTSVSPGLNVNAGARVQAWNNGKFYIDFFKTANGEWKIWHLHRFLTYEAELERGPLYTQYTHDIEMSYKEMADCFTANPDKPTTYFKLFNPKTRNYMLPEPPEPYEEWEGMSDLIRTRPYQNPDIPESMKGEVESIVRLGRGDEGYGKAW
jgi:hypothetical protein